jgi:flagellar hook-associated protein 3 FlgL
MRVTFQATFRNSLLYANKAAEMVQKKSLEVSSGKKVIKGSDDPAAMLHIIDEKNEMGKLDSYIKISDSVNSRLNVVDSVFDDIVNQITVAQTSGTAGRSMLLSQTQRDAIATAIEGSRATILSAAKTQFSGAYIFSGGQSLTAPYTDGTAYMGDSSTSSVTISDGRTAQTTFDGGAVLGDLFDTLQSLADAVRTGNLPGIDTQMANLTTAFDRVSAAQTHIGVDLSRLSEDQARLSSLRLAADTRRSSQEDVNMAISISDWTQAKTAQDAALAALSNAGRQKLLDYLK